LGQGSSNDFGKVHEVDLGSGRVSADSDVVSSGASAGARPVSGVQYVSRVLTWSLDVYAIADLISGRI
jgi:hypothetical protein